jgi:hypothetical protein
LLRREIVAHPDERRVERLHRNVRATLHQTDEPTTPSMDAQQSIDALVSRGALSLKF